jgi:DNA-binding transcriptional MerR regulator
VDDDVDDDVENDLLTIGQFARLSGLSIGALRHYDEVDLLHPAQVDASTGYRRYRRHQLEDAQVIARLRELEMALDEIRQVLAADDPRERARLVEPHRARIEARTNRLQRVLHHVTRISKGDPIVSRPLVAPELDKATRRALAVGLFNYTWTLLETSNRSREQDDEMIHAAHASRYHWGEVGEAVNLARGEWQVSRVYATLGRAEPALYHARRCVEINEANEHGREDWDLGSAYEAMARACAVAGDHAARDEWRERARAELPKMADAEDRRIIEHDLATIPI